MEAAFRGVLEQPTFSCLRMDLEPLTVGHLFMLHQVESPFVTGESLNLVDLMEAVFVCAFPWFKSIHGRGSICMRPFFYLWGRGVRKLDHKAETDKFIEYWTANLMAPAIAHQDPEKEAKTCGSPLPFRLLAMLTSKFGKSEREALNTTILEANSLWAAMGEIEGHFDIRSERQNSLWEFKKQMDAQGISPGDELNN